jgi:hypothetical protein
LLEGYVLFLSVPLSVDKGFGWNMAGFLSGIFLWTFGLRAAACSVQSGIITFLWPFSMAAIKVGTSNADHLARLPF